ARCMGGLTMPAAEVEAWETACTEATAADGTVDEDRRFTVYKSEYERRIAERRQKLTRDTRAFAPLCNLTVEDLVPADHFYRHLEATLDLAFVREWAVCRAGTPGHRSRGVLQAPTRDVPRRHSLRAPVAAPGSRSAQRAV